MTIPKVIHYCWFGGKPLPDKVKTMVASWHKMCPDYKIIQWNESNYDYNKNQYMKDAYKEKKWAFVADYARLDIVYNYGGIYLDTDVELIKSLDKLLNSHAFFALEKQNTNISTGLGFGAEKGNIHIKHLLAIYESISFYNKNGELNLTPCTTYTTEYFKSIGYICENRNQLIDNIQIYSWEYFCPIDFKTGKIEVTEKTIGIHWYDASWLSDSDKRINEIEKKIRTQMPSKIAVIMCFIYRKSYRLQEYIKKGILLNKIRNKIFR